LPLPTRGRMIITCPHCQTRYQVAYEAIGAAGRKVQCAHCQGAWKQAALDVVPSDPDDKLFNNMAEDGLDEIMVEEERRVAAELAARLAAVAEQQATTAATAESIDPVLIRNRQKAFSRRQNARAASMPLGQVRRAARILGSVVLIGLLAVAYFGRVQIVEQFPAAAGLYEKIGLGVNVIGLEISGIQTLRTTRDGKEVLVVSAELVGLKPVPVVIPPVVVTLLNDAGDAIYEWSLTPQVRDLMAGERATIETQLTQPPADAARVRLSFTGAGAVPGAAAKPAAGAAIAISGKDH